MANARLKEAIADAAADVTAALGGSGIWGEFFIGKDCVYFSELSPRPHDTGMVTLGNTQNYSEFELHARAILGIPVHTIPLLQNGASAVVLASDKAEGYPAFNGLDKAAAFPNTDFKIFGKPATRPYRRMAVALAYGEDEVSVLDTAKKVAACISIESTS